MSVDLSKIKPGDEVSIRLKVVSRNSNGVWAKVEGWLDAEAIDLACNAHAIVSHTPRALEVGDDAYHRQYLGTIKAIDGKLAWLKADGIAHEGIIALLSDLERADV